MASAAWALAERQHWVITRAQLLRLGYSADAIKHRVNTGRLHPIWRGVYAVGRPRPGRHGALDGRCPGMRAAGVPESRKAGIRIHRRRGLTDADLTRHLGIPVTGPALTLLDLAPSLSRDQLERAIGEADKRDLIEPESLRQELERFAGLPGIAALRETLDRHTFTLTDSELERRFLPLARDAGLPPPRTQRQLNGFRVDFFWPQLGLVVETDGLRYHRTPAQQANDRLRDQTHAAAGLTPLRFTRAQVTYDPDHVRRTLAAVATRLRAAA